MHGEVARPLLRVGPNGVARALEENFRTELAFLKKFHLTGDWSTGEGTAARAGKIH